MNVASSELCKELYELSGWDDKGLEHWIHTTGAGLGDYAITAPKYYLGYLLEKLKELHKLEHHRGGQSSYVIRIEFGGDGNFWLINCLQGIHGIMDNGRSRQFRDFQVSNDKLVDAACNLAIELFNKGILK